MEVQLLLTIVELMMYMLHTHNWFQFSITPIYNGTVMNNEITSDVNMLLVVWLVYEFVLFLFFLLPAVFVVIVFFAAFILIVQLSYHCLLLLPSLFCRLGGDGDGDPSVHLSIYPSIIVHHIYVRFGFC